MVVCEDIHYDMRRQRVKTMEHEDLVVLLLFPFLLCRVIGTTALLCGVQVNKFRVTGVQTCALPILGQVLPYPAILTNALVPQPTLSLILQNQLGVALDEIGRASCRERV